MKAFIENSIINNNYKATHLLQLLRLVQQQYHYISELAISIISESLKVPRTQVISVIEFYSFLHSQPQGEYELLISDSITDKMLGKDALMDYLAQKLNVAIGSVRADGRVSLNNTSCTGLCEQGPAGLVNGYALSNLTKEKIDLIAYLINSQKPVNEWDAELFSVEDNIQRRDILFNNTINHGDALHATFKRGLTETLNEIDKSGLRGRGGAGFKSALKWRFCSEESHSERYVVCNADEGEPGTFKDRVLLNSHAHQVFEGMTVCAAIVGAEKGFLYLRGEYLFLYDKLQAILNERRTNNLLGENIIGQGFNFDIEIHLGAGAYICGEESALIESLEGKMGVPRNRPPYPVTQGYLNKPTVLKNVETFFAAASISVYGGDWFSALGTEKSRGTKVLSISGDCARRGIYEYPFGTTIETILKDCGASDVLGVQIGGPSGTFISNQEFHRQLSYEDLATGGSFIIFNTSRNILEIVNNFTHFFAHESCGFCTPCRVGTSLLKKQLDKIIDGHGSAGDVVALEELCQVIKNYSHCGLGQTAANPILTTLERYPELYQSKLKNISYEPGFDLDAALDIARTMAKRNDPAAHLLQVEAE